MRRHLTSHFPEVVHYLDVAIQDSEVAGWSRQFSQTSLVLVGAGPPCG